MRGSKYICGVLICVLIVSSILVIFGCTKTIPPPPLHTKKLPHVTVKNTELTDITTRDMKYLKGMVNYFTEEEMNLQLYDKTLDVKIAPDANFEIDYIRNETAVLLLRDVFFNTLEEGDVVLVVYTEDKQAITATKIHIIRED